MMITDKRRGLVGFYVCITKSKVMDALILFFISIGLIGSEEEYGACSDCSSYIDDADGI